MAYSSSAAATRSKSRPTCARRRRTLLSASGWATMRSGDDDVVINPTAVAYVVEDHAYESTFGRRSSPFVNPSER